MRGIAYLELLGKGKIDTAFRLQIAERATDRFNRHAKVISDIAAAHWQRDVARSRS